MPTTRSFQVSFLSMKQRAGHLDREIGRPEDRALVERAPQRIRFHTASHPGDAVERGREASRRQRKRAFEPRDAVRRLERADRLGVAIVLELARDRVLRGGVDAPGEAARLGQHRSEYPVVSLANRLPSALTWIPPSVITAQVIKTPCGWATEP